MTKNKLLKLILSALFLAFAYVLPFLTGSNQLLGKMFLPMHIPVLLCGFICGWYWGLSVGFIAPLLRGLTIGAPPFPTMAVPMAFELATYGAIAGLMHRILPKKKPFIYVSLIIAMVSGRIINGIASAIVMGASGKPYGFEAFIGGALIWAMPGILVQIALIPPLVMVLESKNVLNLNK